MSEQQTTPDLAAIRALLAERDAEVERLTAAVERARAVVVDWGCGTVHQPRSPYYKRLRAALSDVPETTTEEA